MKVMKVIELMSNSAESWEDATRKGVQKASKSLKNVRSVWVKDQSAIIDNGTIKEFRVTLKLSFEVD